MSIYARLVLVLVLLAAIAGQAWWFYNQGWKSRDGQARAQELAAFKQNDRIQVGMQQDADKVQGEKDAKLRSVNRRLADSLASDSMRDRPRERYLPTDPGASGVADGAGLPGADGTIPRWSAAGATGRDLAQPDATWLSRESAAAAGVVVELEACRAQYNAVRGRQPTPSAGVAAPGQ